MSDAIETLEHDATMCNLCCPHGITPAEAQLVIADQISGQSFTTKQPASGPGASAEWINEIFTPQSQAVADFSPVNFSDCIASPSGTPEAVIVPGIENLSAFTGNQFSVQSVPAPDPLSLLGLGCLFLLWRKRGET